MKVESEIKKLVDKYTLQAHREAMGCYFEIKVFDKEEWDRNEAT